MDATRTDEDFLIEVVEASSAAGAIGSTCRTRAASPRRGGSTTSSRSSTTAPTPTSTCTRTTTSVWRRPTRSPASRPAPAGAGVGQRDRRARRQRGLRGGRDGAGVALRRRHRHRHHPHHRAVADRRGEIRHRGAGEQVCRRANGFCFESVSTLPVSSRSPTRSSRAS